MSEDPFETLPDEPNSLNDFRDRFDALAIEARAFGVHSVVALMTHDPLSDASETVVLRRTPPATAIGLANRIIHFAERSFD